MRRAALSWCGATAAAGALGLGLVLLASAGCSCGEEASPEWQPGTEVCRECFELWVWRENWDSTDVHIYEQYLGASPENRVPAGTWELDKSGPCFVDDYLTPEECAAETKSAREDGISYTFAASRSGQVLDTVTFTVRLGDLNDQEQVKYTVAWTGSTLTATKNE